MAAAKERGRDIFDTEISEIAYDSRKATKNTLFVAIKGESLDGHDFIRDAVKRGAIAVVTEYGHREGESAPVSIRVQDSRDALACLSRNFYQRPSESIPVIGVTGTNGKTTTTYLIKSILEAWGKNVGLIGTIRYLINDAEYPALHTTPESLEFQGLLRNMVESGCTYVVTEVSSHALSQKRVDYTRFKSAVFTNLTRDHLDFHGTMQRYYDAKKRLFTELLSGTAVINADDAWGRKLMREMKSDVFTYGVFSEADIVAQDIELTFSGVSFLLLQRAGQVTKIASPLIGMANVYNILAATAAALVLGVPTDVIQEGMRKISPIEGRLEKIDEGQGFTCIVDYAHTPDALERLISAVREITNKERHARIITVFGCGGNRDRGKRPVMGEIATRLSDSVYITSDNPRKEDPLEIIREIESGIIKDNYLIVPDRKDAINMAVDKARHGDVVIIAGKGHEDYQEIRERRYPFNDREVAGGAIRKRLLKEGTLDRSVRHT
ncbi:MAG TPA: UDP-N-acetylmuramoyl-L-alanyl-D-glutamate--2,6-diaminopimelate ligase [Nitrospiraceae bacterium]|nr:UDP-N-acetylmuramoyl-L-alanyl-D-glutamate--2,6-diaminopimelate ligase [Nitrospiraceae bacterium]